MTLAAAIAAGRDRLATGGLECADPGLHMRQLAELALGLNTAKLFVRYDDELTSGELAKLETLLLRRLSGEPFQYIAGKEGFWDADFFVGPGVLIPRRETEHLVELMLASETRERVKVAELGAGTGCVGISLLRERPRWEWHTFEINPHSLPYVDRNRAALLPPTAQYHRHFGDFFALAGAQAPFDWVTSNPPYVPAGDWFGLSREVRHEPRLALDGGPEGMDVIDELAKWAASHLVTGGRFMSEMDSRQGSLADRCLHANGFVDVRIHADAAGLPRIVTGRKP